jgi:hypothetical protein
MSEMSQAADHLLGRQQRPLPRRPGHRHRRPRPGDRPGDGAGRL